MDKYLEHLSGDTKEYVTKLKINMDMVDTVEKATINQATSSIWIHHRKGRLPASMNNPKTEKGLLSAAQHLVNGLSTKNKVLQLKLSHGKFYEPIALSKCQQYMKSINHDIQVWVCSTTKTLFLVPVLIARLLIFLKIPFMA